jgi:hypothetical protein
MAVGAHVVFPLAGPATPDAELARLLSLGLDWIESDDPVRLLGTLTRSSFQHEPVSRSTVSFVCRSERSERR